MPVYNRSILVVEDHQDTSDLIALLIKMWGYEVAASPTAIDALRLARERSFDLYLLDYRLPDGTGVELCRAIREFDSTTPVLFCSASAYPFNIEEARAAGAQKYLTKPIDPNELKSTLAQLMGNS